MNNRVLKEKKNIREEMNFMHKIYLKQIDFSYHKDKISDLIEPDWLVKKVTILNDIDKEMARRNTYQGIKYQKKD